MKKHAVVIGSGIGGLASAIRLAHAGFDVSVYEKNAVLGGKVHSKTLGAYRFDMGPSVFTEPHLVDELLGLASKPVSFSYSLLPESCRYFFSDGQQIVLKSGTSGTKASLTNDLNEDPIAVESYLERISKNYRLLRPVFIESSLHRWSDWFNRALVPAILNIPFYGLFQSMDRWAKKRFKNPKTVQMLNRFATYNGSDPYQTPGLLSIIGHLELNIGAFFPEGGMVSISQSLIEAAKSLGVSFYEESPVSEIKHERGRVSGVCVKGKAIPADVVVCNADVHYVYETLLPGIKPPSRILQQEMSSSAIVFYWGIKKKFDALGVHNILFAEDYEAEFNAIFKEDRILSDPTVYIHISSKMEPTDAASYGENWFVMVNAPIDRGQDWPSIVTELRQQVLIKLQKQLGEDVAPWIEEEFVNDPTTLATQYNGKAGSIYGNSSNSKMAAFYRHPNAAFRLKGLYFSGVTVHPGGGIPLAIQGAKIVERMVHADFKGAI